MIRSPLLPLLLAALLLRGLLAPGVMPERHGDQLVFAMCGPSGGEVTLDLGGSTPDHSEEQRCLYAGLATPALPGAIGATLRERAQPVFGATRAVAVASRPHAQQRARGPPVPL